MRIGPRAWSLALGALIVAAMSIGTELAFGAIVAARVLAGTMHGLFVAVALAIGVTIVPPERMDEAMEAVRRTGFDPALAGRVEAGEGVVLRGPTGREASLEGFDQVRSRAAGEPS